jgi:ribose 5-phosphate isomerase A
MNDKKKQAAEAALAYIKPGQTIGFGAGTTIGHLVGFIKDLSFLETLLFVTPSYKTKGHLKTMELNTRDISEIKEIDFYFDSCDHYDLELNALKSGGGIHTREKLMASMAKEFILLVDESKFNAHIMDTVVPLCVEILPAAESFVWNKLKVMYPHAELQIRMGQQKDGAVITENGNMLLDVKFKSHVPLEQLNQSVKLIPGVIEHSLFYRLASKALVAESKRIKILNPTI